MIDVLNPAELLRIGLSVWLALFASMVLAKFTQGEINLTGLFCTHVGGPVDPMRVQLFIGAVAATVIYAHTALYGDPPMESADPAGLVAPPDLLLLLFGGSNAGYLFTKYLTCRH